jgi:hypothetical protein
MKLQSMRRHFDEHRAKEQQNMISRSLKHSRLPFAPALALLSILALATSAVAQAGDHDSARNSIVGTWRVQVTTYNCATGVQNPPFASFLTFGSHGTLVETTASLGFAPGQRSPGHGIWTRTGGDDYQAISEAFILFTTPANPPAPGLQRGTQRITQAIDVDGDQLTSAATIEFLDTAGNVLVTGCASAIGQRFK